MKKRIISILVVLIMLFNCQSIIAADTNSDESSDYNQKVEKLLALGLIPTTIDFKDPNAKVTRVNFLKIALQYTGYTMMIPKEVPADLFNDVDKDYVSAKEIAAGVSLGMLTGYSNGNFYPESFITLNQAVKILVNALGYSVKADINGGYPSGHLIIARDLKILKGVSTEDEELTNQNMISLLDNALEAKILEITKAGNESTKYEQAGQFLSERHDLYVVEDVVNATSDNAKLGLSETLEGKVVIGDTTLEVGNKQDIALYLGYKVQAYYQKTSSDTFGTLMYFTLHKDNDVIYVTSEDILGDSSDFTAYSFVYYDKESDQNEKVDITGANVIINGKTDPYYSRNDLCPVNGDVKLIDNNDDGVIDFINVFKPTKIMLVENISIDGASTVLFNLLDRANTVTLDANDKNSKFKIVKNGIVATANDITKFDTVLVGESRDSSYKLLYVNGSAVSGTITGTDTEQRIVYIGENSYKYSKNYEDLANTNSNDYAKKLEPGKSGVFYVDSYGIIQGFKQDSATDLKYGYILKADNPTNEFKKLTYSYKIKMLTTNNEIVVFSLKDKLDFNNVRITDEEALVKIIAGGASIDAGKGTGCRQLIKYTASDENVISSIYTADSDGVLTYDGYDYQEARYGYYLNTWSRKVWRTASTPMFAIYDDDEQCECSFSYENDEANFDKNTVYFYDLDDILTTGATVRYYQGAASVSNGTISDTANLILVKSLVTGIDADELPARFIKGYTVSGTETLISVGERTNDAVKAVFDSVVPGDIVLFGVDNKGSLNALYKVFNSQDKYTYGSGGGGTKPASPQGLTLLATNYSIRWLMYGECQKMIDSNLLLYCTGTASNPANLIRQNIGSIQFACLDISGTVPKITPKYSYTNIKPGDKIFLTGRYGDVKQGVVIKTN